MSFGCLGRFQDPLLNQGAIKDTSDSVAKSMLGADWVFPKIVVLFPPQIIHLFIGFSINYKPSILGGLPPLFWFNT